MNALISECFYFSRMNSVSNERDRREWSTLTRNYGQISLQVYFKNTSEEGTLLTHLIKLLFLKIYGISSKL